MKRYLWLAGVGFAAFAAMQHQLINPNSNLFELSAPAIAEASIDTPDWVKQAPVSRYVTHEDNERFYQKYRITPEWMVIRAFLRSIGRMEGTYDPSKPNQVPYQIIFGFRTFTDYSKHPDICVPINGWGHWSNQCSTAAGMSQWVITTWNGTRSRWRDGFWYDDGEFSPRNQDLGTLRLMIDRGVYDKLLTGIRLSDDRNQVAFDEPTYKNLVDRNMSRVWASYPCFTGMKYRASMGACDGTSFYGQGGKSYEAALRYLREELAKENQGEWLKQLRQQ